MLLIPIKSRLEFVDLNKSATRFYSNTIIVLAKKTPQKYFLNPRTGELSSFCRVGYTVTKKVAKSAVVRNRLKRRCREAFRLVYKNYALEFFDHVIVVKKEAIDADFIKIINDLKFCLQGLRRLSQQNLKNDLSKQGK